MSLIATLGTLWRGQSIDKFSTDVADRSVKLVRGLVQPKATSMGRAEVRGYIRAKAGPIIRAQVDALYQRQPRLRPSLKAILIAQATDRVVQAVQAGLNVSAPRRRAA